LSLAVGPQRRHTLKDAWISRGFSSRPFTSGLCAPLKCQQASCGIHFEARPAMSISLARRLVPHSQMRNVARWRRRLLMPCLRYCVTCQCQSKRAERPWPGSLQPSSLACLTSKPGDLSLPLRALNMRTSPLFYTTRRVVAEVINCRPNHQCTASYRCGECQFARTGSVT
jgi:hypothetical protein